MANKYNKLFDFGEEMGIGGDFQINPDAVADVYSKRGYDLPLSMQEVRQEVFNAPMPKTVKAPAAMKPIDIKFVEPKKVSSATVPVVKPNAVPSWATALGVAGLPIGLVYGISKGSGFWGVVE